jgi:hypothetical protein
MRLDRWLMNDLGHDEKMPFASALQPLRTVCAEKSRGVRA